MTVSKKDIKKTVPPPPLKISMQKKVKFRMNEMQTEESGRTDDEDVSQAGGEHMTVGILHVHDIEGTGVTLPATKNNSC
jgi:hypothetical protein